MKTRCECWRFTNGRVRNEIAGHYGKVVDCYGMYKQIPDHPNYEASTEGNVRRIGKRHDLTPWVHNSGHLYVRLDGKTRQIHRLVLSANGIEIPFGHECRHIDGNPKNNRLDNLTTGTRRQNIMDYIAKEGRHMSPNATPCEIARKIRAEHDGKKGTGKRLALKYGVSVHTVSAIKNNKTFKYI